MVKKQSVRARSENYLIDSEKEGERKTKQDGDYFMRFEFKYSRLHRLVIEKALLYGLASAFLIASQYAILFSYAFLY